jgi:hypothetical protein
LHLVFSDSGTCRFLRFSAGFERWFFFHLGRGPWPGCRFFASLTTDVGFVLFCFSLFFFVCRFLSWLLFFFLWREGSVFLRAQFSCRVSLDFLSDSETKRVCRAGLVSRFVARVGLCLFGGWFCLFGGSALLLVEFGFCLPLPAITITFVSCRSFFMYLVQDDWGWHLLVVSWVSSRWRLLAQVGWQILLW